MRVDISRSAEADLERIIDEWVILYGVDLAKLYAQEVMLCLYELKIRPQTGCVLETGPNLIETQYAEVRGLAVVFQRFSTHIYVLRVVDREELPDVPAP